MKVNLMLIGLVVIAAGVLGLLGKIAWDKGELGRVNNTLNEQLMQSKLAIGRAHTQLGYADGYANRLEGELQDEINRRNAEITRYGELEAKYSALKEYEGEGKVIYIEGSETQASEYVKGQIYSAISRTQLRSVGHIAAKYQDHRIDALCRFTPDPKVAPAIPFSFKYDLHLTFTGVLVETLTPSGAINHYINLWELDEHDKKIGKIEVTRFDVVVNDQRAIQFFWWAPHLDVGILLGFRGNGQFAPGGSLGISIMGYGLTKNDLAWRFLRLSMDLSGQAGVGFSPVQYNMGEFIPLVSNLWLGPHFTYFLSAEREWMLGIMVGAVL